MIIYPAIDIRNGKCVRLYQGNYSHETVYNDSPLDTAKAFIDKGANWIHLVDLDGAKNPNVNQASLIKALLKSVPISIQVGGGIREETQIESYIAAGASRVVIGSLAVESPDVVARWLKKYGSERIVLALDVILNEAIPFVMTQGWQKQNNITFFDLVEFFLDYGIQHILCTDISKDGALNGPNIDLYQMIISRFPKLNIQASGGISYLNDIRRLKEINAAGAIIGRALYEKKFDLSGALSC